MTDFTFSIIIKAFIFNRINILDKNDHFYNIFQLYIYIYVCVYNIFKYVHSRSVVSS